jgi:hypothetical protein
VVLLAGSIRRTITYCFPNRQVPFERPPYLWPWPFTRVLLVAKIAVCGQITNNADISQPLHLYVILARSKWRHLSSYFDAEPRYNEIISTAHLHSDGYRIQFITGPRGNTHLLEFGFQVPAVRVLSTTWLIKAAQKIEPRIWNIAACSIVMLNVVDSGPCGSICISPSNPTAPPFEAISKAGVDRRQASHDLRLARFQSVHA